MEVAHQLVPWMESLPESACRDWRGRCSSNVKHVKIGDGLKFSYSTNTIENKMERKHKMRNQGEASIPQRNKTFLLIGIVAAGFAFCAVMRTFVCKKTGENCPC
jgi:hypothetical protein